MSTHYCVRIGTRMLNSEPLTQEQASALALATGGVVFRAAFL